MLVFQSDNMYAGAGFDASYQIDNTGIADQTLSDNLQVFPNPATRILNIRLDESLAGNKVVTILSSLDGKEIFKRIDTPKTGRLSKTIDISNVEQGVYLLTIEADKGMATRKIIVQ